MVAKSLTCAAVLAAASATYAGASFENIGADFGGALGSLGNPLAVTGGSLYSPAATGGSADVFTHNLLVGTSAALGAGIGIAAVAPSAPTHTPGVNAPNAFASIDNVENYLDSASFINANPNQLQGVWLNNNIITSGTHPDTGNPAMWLGRFGLTTGASWDTASHAGAMVTVREDPGEPEQNIIAKFDLTGDVTTGGFVYRLDMRQIATNVAITNTNGIDVYDLWLEQVPTPGTVAMAGLGGFAMLRRRRG